MHGKTTATVKSTHIDYCNGLLRYYSHNDRLISECNQPPRSTQPGHHSGVGKWRLASAGKENAGMVHADERGCAGKTVRSFENACRTWAP